MSIYGFIGFEAFILFVTMVTSLNLLLGFRYDSNLMIFKGLVLMFIIISIMRVEDFAGPLAYNLLLLLVATIGSIVVFTRKNMELLLLFMLLSYIWVTFSVLLMDRYTMIPLLGIITIITTVSYYSTIIFPTLSINTNFLIFFSKILK